MDMQDAGMLRVFEYYPQEDLITEPHFEYIKFETQKLIFCFAPTEEEERSICRKLAIPLEVIKNALQEDMRPTTIERGHFSQVVLKVPVKRKSQLLTLSFSVFMSEKLMLVLSKDYLEPLTAFERTGLEVKKPLFRRGTTFLLYMLFEEVMDAYFKDLDEIEENINIIETHMLDVSKHKSLSDVFRVKTSLIYFAKSVTALRDVVIALEKGLVVHIDQNTAHEFMLVYNDIIQLTDIIGTYREVLSESIEIYLTSISNGLNTSIKRMTAWGSLVLIPTFIASLYGMNFKYMPEIYWRWGYIFALGLILVSVVFLYILFKRRGDLR
jgi:magnesium transporter